MSAEKGPSTGYLVSFLVGASLWALVTLASAIQGQLFAASNGRIQDWWSTLGYTAAVFSVWALLTPVVLHIADRIIVRGARGFLAAALWLLGYPVTTALHLLIFILMFWPIYGAGFPTPFAMAEPVLLANIDKAAFAYVALIAFAYLRRRRREHEDVEDRSDTSPPKDDGLWIRAAGASQFVRFDEIDWIAAAGDYAEVHAGDRSMLADTSLASLADQLPQDEFTRIHRGSIVRLDRVREVRGIGRGDASLFLHNGQSLRLSRRYRRKVAVHLPL